MIIVQNLPPFKLIKKWWYELGHTIHFSFEIGISGLLFHLSIFSSEFLLQFNALSLKITLSEFLKKILTWKVQFKLCRDKSFMIKMMPDFQPGIGFTLNHSIHRPHAGIFIELKLIIFTLIFDICDWRRWDHENNKWMHMNDIEIEDNFQYHYKKWIEWRNKERVEVQSIEDYQYENSDYKAIIALGMDVVPHLINQLRVKPGLLFEALKEMLQYDPVKPEHVGDIEKMAQDWIEYWNVERWDSDYNDNEILSIQNFPNQIDDN
jgi:hypothetical protein